MRRRSGAKMKIVLESGAKHTMKSEEQLVHDIHGGDRSAMRRLYDRYSGLAMATALRYVPERDDACDIVQDAFVKVFQSVAQFEYRGEGSLRSWLLRIVANEALGFLRRRSGLSFTDDIPDTSSDDEPPDIGSLTDDELSALIASLPEGYRVVLNMYVFGEMSHKEIAAELGITPSTSASQFFHAKKLLARMIKEHIRKEKQ